MHNNGWWGEGEIKFYLDGDKQFPTISGTGTEDYFCGSYNFENQEKKQYEQFTTPYTGLIQAIKPDGLYQSQQRFGLYRWHITDPVRFGSDLKVTIQALGWRPNQTYLPLQDDIASVAYWYQSGTTRDFPETSHGGAIGNRVKRGRPNKPHYLGHLLLTAEIPERECEAPSGTNMRLKRHRLQAADTGRSATNPVPE